MDIRRAYEYSNLSQTSPTPLKQNKSAADVALRVFALAAQSGRIEGTPKEWQKEWLSSGKFFLMDIPPHLAACPFRGHNQSKVLECMRASADSLEPIVVDLNKKQLGQPSVSSYYPPVIVIHGHAQHQGSMLGGREKIRAWVGELAAQELGLLEDKKVVIKEVKAAAMPKRESVTPLEASMRINSCIGGKPFPKLKSKVKAAGGMGGPGASLSNGSGPSMATKPMPNPGRPMPMMRTAKKKLKANTESGGYQGYKDATKTQSDKTRGASNSEMASKLRGSGYFGYTDATDTFRQKTKGGTKSEMTDQLKGSASNTVKKIVTKFRAACSGGYKPEMKSVAPPGMEHVVKGLKKNFGKGSSSPFAIAWWLHNKKKGKSMNADISRKGVDLGERPPKVANPAKGI